MLIFLVNEAISIRDSQFQHVTILKFTSWTED